MTNPNNDVDPLAGGGNPSLSFKDLPFGTSYRVTVTEPGKLVHSIDFESGELAYWPAGKDGVSNPIMSAVYGVDLDGEARTLWAKKPSALFAALQVAQKNAGGHRIGVGDVLTVTYTHDVPNAKNPRLNPAKQYTVTLEPRDILAEPAVAPAQQPAAQQPAAQLPYTPPTPANVGTFGETADKVRKMAAEFGMPAAAIAAALSLDVAKVEAILTAGA